MLNTFSSLFGLVLSTTAPAMQADVAATFLPSPAMEISIEEWGPRKGDRFLVDTKENIGYLIHTDGVFARFLVATGRNETVRYLGMTYKATTPEAEWIAGQKVIQSDRITFGEKGHFLRLFRDGKPTKYGIHDYAYLEDILDGTTEERFFSMGCVLVPDDILQTLEKVFTLNGGSLEVKTMYGLDEAVIAKN